MSNGQNEHGAGERQHVDGQPRESGARDLGAIKRVRRGAERRKESSGYVEVPKGAKSVRLTFGGYHDTTPADNDFAYQIVLWRRTADQGSDASASVLYTPELVAKGVATLGTLVMQDSAGDGDYLYADTITNTQTIQRPDVLVFSPADNTLGWIYVELGDAIGIEVEVDCDGGSGTAVSKAYVFARFEEEAHPFFRLSRLSELVGGINDTTTDSLHGKIGTDSEMGDASLYDMLTAGVGTTGCAVKSITRHDLIDSNGYTLFTASGNVLITNLIVSNGTTAFSSAGQTAVLVLKSYTTNLQTLMSINEADLGGLCLHDFNSAGGVQQRLALNQFVAGYAEGEDFTSTGSFAVIATYLRLSAGATLTT